MRYLSFIIGASLWLGKISAKPSTVVGGSTSEIVAVQKEKSGTSLISAQTPILGPQVPLASGGNSLLLSPGFYRTPSPILGREGGSSTSEIVAVQKEKSGTSLISAQTPILGPQVPLASGGSSLLLSPGIYRTPSPIFGMGGDRCVSEGSFVMDAYYGFITLAGPLLRLIGAASGAETSILGPIGLRGEYMVSNVVGLGGDLQFNRYSLSWTETIYGIYGVPYTYSYKINWTRIRAMARVAFHFAVSRAVDPYFAISGGLRIESFSTETNDPDYNVGIAGVAPAIRLALGTRFFFTPNIGAFLELGVFGGGLFHVGLSAKLK
jgi:hypothetical protein